MTSTRQMAAPTLGRVNLSASLFPSPPRSRSPIAGPSQIRSSNFTSQHSTAHTAGSSSSDDNDVQQLLSLQEAQVLSKGRLRSVVCLWRNSDEHPCGGILASVELLQQHLARHVHAYAKNMNQHDEPYEAGEQAERAPAHASTSNIRCRWDRCQYREEAEAEPDYDRLLDHVETIHIGRLVRDHCPHKNCTGKPLSDNISAHAYRSHPGMWTEDSLRPSRPTTRPITPVRQLRPLPTNVVPWLILCQEVRPKGKAPLPPPIDPSPQTRLGQLRAALRSRAPSETSSTASDKVWPIMHDRDPNDFWPMNGEAESDGNSSSSIFPPIPPHPDDDDDPPTPIHPAVGWLGAKDAMLLKVIKKPEIPPRIRLFPGADVYARAIKADRAARKLELKAKATDEAAKVEPEAAAVAAKGKRKAPEWSEQEQYSADRIMRASIRRARRRTGRTVGYRYLEEMVAFENRGIELGELPPDFPLTK